MDEKRNEITGNQVDGNFVSVFLTWNCENNLGDHQRYKETYFTAFPGKYFTGTEGALETKQVIIELQVV